MDIGIDVDVQVTHVQPYQAVKDYRCPGCDHELKPGIAHVLVWPADAGESAVEDRRHWHTSCWANRRNRNPTRKWS